MSTLSALLGDSAGKYTLVSQGVKYSVSRVTQATKAAFERWLKMNAMAAILEQKEWLPSDVWQEAYAIVSRDMAGKNYSFHGAASQMAMKQPAGALAFASILFGIEDTEMLSVMKDKSKEVKALLDLVVAESNSDPNV